MKPPLRNLLPLPFPSALVTPTSSQMDVVFQSLMSQGMISVAQEVSRFVRSPEEKRVSSSNFQSEESERLSLSPKKFRLVNHAKIPSFLQAGETS